MVTAALEGDVDLERCGVCVLRIGMSLARTDSLVLSVPAGSSSLSVTTGLQVVRTTVAGSHKLAGFEVAPPSRGRLDTTSSCTRLLVCTVPPCAVRQRCSAGG